MTPEMIAEIEDGLVERTGGWCFRIEQDADECDPDRPQAQAFGVLIVDSHGNALAVECAIAEDGSGQVTARAYDAGGADKYPSVFSAGNSVFITT